MSHTSNQQIRVVQVARPAEGGIRAHLEVLSPRLQDRGMEVEIVAPPGMELRIAAPITRAPIYARPHPLRDLQAARIIASIAMQSRPADLLHGHGLRGAWIACLAARRASRPFLWTAHNLAPQRPSLFAALALRHTARRAAAIVAVSSAVARSLSSIGASIGSVSVIPNGIDLARFDCDIDLAAVRRRLGFAPEDRLVAAVGRLSPEKGFDVLVHAAPAVLRRCPMARIAIAGEGTDRDRLTALAETLQVTERVALLGRTDDVPELLAAAEVVVAPSLAEGQGITILEAMAARRSVVATRVGGIPEVVDDGRTGLLVPPGDPAALAAALTRLMEDGPSRMRMGAAGRALVEARFTAGIMADRIAALYAGLINRTTR